MSSIVFNPLTGNGSFNVAFTNVPSSTLTATVEDNYGGTSTGNSYTVTVTPVVPIVTITGITSTELATNTTNSDTSSIPEGSVNHYTFTTADPGVGDTFSLTAPVNGTLSNPPANYTFGNVVFNANTGAGSFDIYFPVLGTFTPPPIVVKDMTNGLSGSESIPSVTVNYVQPSLTISGTPNPVAAGSIYALTLNSSDPGYDPQTGWTINWGDGSAPQIVVMAASATAPSSPYVNGWPSTWGSSITVQHAYLTAAASPGATYNITATGTDTQSANTYTAAPNPLAVVVNDVVPTVTWVTDPSTATEGQTVTYQFKVTDPGSDGPFNPLVYLGNDGVNPINAVSTPVIISPYVAATETVSGTSVTTTPATESFSFTVTFANPTYTPPAAAVYGAIVSAQVRDIFGQNSNTATQSVAVADVMPTVTSLLGPTTVYEGVTVGGGGGPYLYQFAVSDPGINDTFSVVSANGGVVGTVSGLTINTTAGTATGSFYVTFSKGSVSGTADTLSIQVQDNYGMTSATKTLPVTVFSVAPICTISGSPSPVNEGATYTLTLTAAEPGNHAVSSWLINWGDSSAGDPYYQQTVAATLPTWSSTTGQWVSTTTVTHSFVYGPGGYTVSATPTDDDGTWPAVTVPVVVADVVPAVAFTYSSPTSVNEGSTVTYAFTTTDPDVADTFSLVSGYPKVVGWGTVSNVTINSNTGTGSFSVNWGDGPASPTVQIEVADKDGGTSLLTSLPVTIANVSPTVNFVNPPTTAMPARPSPLTSRSRTQAPPPGRAERSPLRRLATPMRPSTSRTWKPGRWRR